jgi:iron complex transport system ATP-binding protein
MLDEPTVHLDIRHQLEVIDLLADLVARDGRTVVTVLHDLQLAARVPRIVVVAGGRIAADGPAEVALRGEVIRDVFDVPPERLPPGPWSAAPASVADDD